MSDKHLLLNSENDEREVTSTTRGDMATQSDKLLRTNEKVAAQLAERNAVIAADLATANQKIAEQLVASTREIAAQLLLHNDTVARDAKSSLASQFKKQITWNWSLIATNMFIGLMTMFFATIFLRYIETFVK